MAELVDSVDLGDISSGKDFLFAACFRMEYAPVAKLVYAADLGSAAKSVGVRIPSGAPILKSSIFRWEYCEII